MRAVAVVFFETEAANPDDAVARVDAALEDLELDTNGSVIAEEYIIGPNPDEAVQIAYAMLGVSA